MTYRLHDQLIDSVTDYYLYILYFMWYYALPKQSSLNLHANPDCIHAHVLSQLYHYSVCVVLQSICNMLLWKHSLNLSNSIASSVKKQSTYNEQCETNALTNGATDCATQALPCTEQNNK